MQVCAGTDSIRSGMQDNAGTRCSSGHAHTGQVIGFVEAAKHATAGIATFAD